MGAGSREKAKTSILPPGQTSSRERGRERVAFVVDYPLEGRSITRAKRVHRGGAFEYRHSEPYGKTNVYIHYQNIPGYQDGDFVSVIEKSAVVYKEQNVGVGASNPDKRLHLKGAGDQEIMIESADPNGVKWSLQSSSGASERTLRDCQPQHPHGYLSHPQGRQDRHRDNRSSNTPARSRRRRPAGYDREQERGQVVVTSPAANPADASIFTAGRPTGII